MVNERTFIWKEEERVFSEQAKSCKPNKTITARYNINECKIGKELQKEIKGMFWNTAGIAKKDEEFWDYVRDFDIINFTET